MHRLTFKAPNRCWFLCGNDMWDSRPWTKDDRIDAALAGAWFGNTGHEFADKPTERSDAATGLTIESKEDNGNVLNGLLGKLSPEERRALMAELRQ